MASFHIYRDLLDEGMWLSTNYKK